jgi:hypothetical protein
MKSTEYQRQWRAKNREKSIAATLRWYHRNKEKVNANKRQWRAANKQKMSLENYKWTLAKYGLNSSDYDRILAEQDGVCAICLQVERVKYHGKVGRLSIDHDPRGGFKAVRGLLCSQCNHLLGQSKDSIAILKRAVQYLIKANLKLRLNGAGL